MKIIRTAIIIVMLLVPDFLFSMPLSIAIRSDITSFDPTRQDDVSSTSIILQVYEGLFGYNVHGDIEPVLVSDWSLSNDNMVYDFFLKRGVKFSNGKELKAGDVKYSFERIADKKSINSWAIELVEGCEDFVRNKTKSLSGIKVLDDYHVQIKLKEPHQPFLSLLASVYFKVVAPHPSVKENIGLNLVGTGPYKIDEYVPNQKVILSHNMYYHSKLNNIEKIIVYILPYREAHEWFNAGALDMLKYYPEGPPITNSRAKRMTAYQYTVWYNVCNLGKFPCYNADFRKAIFYAVDRKALADSIGGASFAAKGYIPEGLLVKYDYPMAESYNPFLALGFLKKVNLPNDFVFEITLCNSTPKVEAVAKLYQKFFEDIGVKTRFHFYDYKEFYAMKRKGEYTFIQMNTIPSYADPDAVLFPYFYSKSNSNIAHIDDKKLDDLLIEARREHDIEKRMSLNTKVNQHLMDNAYVIPNYSENITLYVNENLTVPPVSGLGVWFLEYKHVNWNEG